MSENGSEAQAFSQTIKIQGLLFTAPSPYGAGHTLTANEASAMNQLLAENLRNNFAKKVQTAKEEAEKAGTAFPTDGSLAPAEMQAEFDSYATDYEFGARRSGGGGDSSLPKDPIQRQAHLLAREMIRQHAKSKNIKIDAEQVAALVPGLLAKRPDILVEAQRRVEAQANISIEEIELPEAPAQEAVDPNAAPAEATDEAEASAPRSGRRGKK